MENEKVIASGNFHSCDTSNINVLFSIIPIFQTNAMNSNTDPENTKNFPTGESLFNLGTNISTIFRNVLTVYFSLTQVCQ